MTTRHRYITVAMSLIIIIGLALPFCCHTGVSVETAHSSHQQMAFQQAQTQQRYSPDCFCGHQLRKEIVKKSNDFSQSLQQPQHLSVHISEPVFADILQSRLIQFLTVHGNQAAPPLYLLNSVFLN